MNKLKELYRDFRDFPALLISVILVAAIIAFFGYIFYLKGGAENRNENAATNTVDNMQKKSGNILINEPDEIEKNNDVPEEETEELENSTVLVDGDIKVLANAGMKDFEVFKGNAKMGEIKRAVPSQVNVFKRIGGDVYLGVNNDGLGGYILFGGPRAVYKIDTKNNSLLKVFDKEDMFVSDISSDGKRLAYVEGFYVGDELRIYINVYNLDDYQSKSYQVPVEYKTAGNAYFSKDGGKIVYEAAINNPDDEKFAMFLVDLATGEQTKVGGNDSYNQAKVWAENN